MAFGDIGIILQPIIDGAASKAAAFVPLGQTFLALSITLALLFAVYDWWTGAVSGAVSRLIRAGLILTIPLTLLTGDHWVSSMKIFSEFFTKEMTAPILVTSGSGSGPDAIRDTVNKLTKSMFPDTRKVDGRSEFDKAWDFLTGQQSVGGAVSSALTEALFEVILFFVSVLVSLALVVALYGPLFAFQIGVIFGPMLLAWMPYQPFAHLARNWLAFMITQGFALVVGVTVAVIGAEGIEVFTDMMAVMGNDPNLPLSQELAAKLGGFASAIAAIFFVGLTMFRADHLAAAMTGGGGAGSSGIGAVILNKISPRGGKGGGKPDKPGGGAGGDK